MLDKYTLERMKSVDCFYLWIRYWFEVYNKRVVYFCHLFHMLALSAIRHNMPGTRPAPRSCARISFVIDLKFNFRVISAILSLARLVSEVTIAITKMERSQQPHEEIHLYSKYKSVDPTHVPLESLRMSSTIKGPCPVIFSVVNPLKKSMLFFSE